MYVLDKTDNKIYAYTLSSGARVSGKDITLHADNANGTALWSDGTTMWVTDSTDDKVYAYKLSDGSRVTAKDYTGLTDAGNTSPVGIWSDGTTAWISDSTGNSQKLYAYHTIAP